MLTRYDNVILSPLLLPAREKSGLRVMLSYLDVIRYDEKSNLRYQVSFVKLKHHNDQPNHGVDRKISEVMISTKAEHNPD
jgi:hypothetical protein